MGSPQDPLGPATEGQEGGFKSRKLENGGTSLGPPTVLAASVHSHTDLLKPVTLCGERYPKPSRSHPNSTLWGKIRSPQIPVCFFNESPPKYHYFIKGRQQGGPILCTLEGVGKVGEHLRWGPFTVLSRVPRCGRSPQRTRQVLPLPPASLPSFLPQTLTELILPGAQRGAAERAGKGS